MKNTLQNKLFKYIVSSSNIDDIQSRFIAFRLEQNDVTQIYNITDGDEVNNYIFKTDIGYFKIIVVNLPIPITQVIKML
jgi:hypothetical protein